MINLKTLHVGSHTFKNFVGRSLINVKTLQVSLY